MISMPDSDGSARLTPLQCLLHGVPRAYAILFFSPSVRLGWLLLAVSLLSPGIGLSGLAGAVAAGGIAWALGFDPARIRNGYLLFNPLLVCLTLGWMERSHHFPPALFLVLWLAAVLGGLFVTVAMQQAFAQHFGLSAQSLPAMAVVYVLYFLSFALAGPIFPAVEMGEPWLELGFLPGWMQDFFRVFGSMVFEPYALPGLCVFVALFLSSSLSALLASVALAVGLGTVSLLGYHAGPGAVTWCGFNFLLCGIALGGVYFVPSRMSLLLAVAGAFLCALLILALASVLHFAALPVGALPYNLVVLIVVYALNQRQSPAGLHASPVAGISPEAAGRLVLLHAARFPHLPLPALDLPFKDECVVTQGINGAVTHRAPWEWALDLEVLCHNRRWQRTGADLEDYHTFDRLVLAPCSGTVVAVKVDVPDNMPGTNNPQENWGNYVVIQADAGYHVLLSHLRLGSPLVSIGRRIISGEPLGHCGNSGRSPIPHLHLQVQDAAYPGAPTRPFCLRNVIQARTADAPPTYLTSVIPTEGARLAPPTPLPALHALFCNWLPGSYRYRVQLDHEPERNETLLLDFDEKGRFRLRSRERGARLSAFLSENVFYAVDYEGARDSLLAVIATGLARVPCLADPDIFWGDQISPALFQHGLRRKLHDIIDPYWNPALLAYRYSMQAGEQGYEIHCQRQKSVGKSRAMTAGVPNRIITTLSSRVGIQRIVAQLGSGATLRAELIDSPLAVQGLEFLPELTRPVTSIQAIP